MALLGPQSEDEFQSLSGFQVRCNSVHVNEPSGLYTVSIPVGFSSALQPNLGVFGQCIALAFQSLSGFQVRCN